MITASDPETDLSLSADGITITGSAKRHIPGL